MKYYLHGLKVSFWLSLFLVVWPIQVMAYGEISVKAFTKDFENQYGEISLPKTIMVNPNTMVKLQVKIKKGMTTDHLTWGTKVLSLQQTDTEIPDYDVYECICTALTAQDISSSPVYQKVEGNLVPDTIVNGQCLVNILNYYQDGSARISDYSAEKVVVTKGSSTSSFELVFDTKTHLTVEFDGGYLDSDIKVGSNITFIQEGDSHYPYLFRGTVILEPFSELSLINVGYNRIQQNGGTLTLKRTERHAYDDLHVVNNLSSSGGKINLQVEKDINHDNLNYFVDTLTIHGDTEINGINQFDDEDWTYDRYPYLSNVLTIERGSVHFSRTVFNCIRNIIYGGNVCLDQCTLRDYYADSKVDPCFDLRGGELTFKNSLLWVPYEYPNYLVEVHDSKLTVDSGMYGSGKKGIIYLSGESAHVCIKDGDFSSDPSTITIYQEQGELEIEGGVFSDPICIETGTMTISGGVFSDNWWNGKHGAIHILSDDAQVKLSGGHFPHSGFMFHSSNKSERDFLSSGYDFYSFDELLQPDIPQSVGNDPLLMPYCSFIQVKRITSNQTNSLLEAAKVADVGPNGRDVKVIELNDPNSNKYWIPCELEINTAIGMAWFASQFEYHGDAYNKCGVGYKKGASIIRLTADVDMSAFDWIPFNLNSRFDGQGHIIRGIKCHQSAAAFIYEIQRDGVLLNLIVSGEFKSIETDYTGNRQFAAGLCTWNMGTIVNCGVENSSIQVQTNDRISADVGGLVASNWGSIQNSYMTGNVTCHAQRYDESCPTLRYAKHRVGGLVSEESGTLINSYQAGGEVVHDGSDLSSNLSIDINNIGCTNNPDLKTLNQAVENYNKSLSNDMIRWSQWKIEANRNSNYPIHEYIQQDGPIIIDKDQNYQMPNHAGRILLVKSGVTYTIDSDNAWVDMLIIEDGGKLDLRKPLAISQGLEFYREAITDRWTTLGIPSGLDVVVKNNEGNGSRDIYFKSGYLTPSEQSWNISDYLQQAEAGKPYLMTADHIDRNVTFYYSGHIVLSAQTDMDGLVNTPNGSWFQFVTNPLWRDLQLSGCAYVLNEEGNSFELQEDPIIPPFHAYLIASESIMKSVYSLRVGSVTANEMLTTNRLRAWVENGALCLETPTPETVGVYSISGTTIGKYPNCVGTVRVSLPKGIYIVICQGEAIKVIL